ncbi:hypothetical protein [Rhizobium sp. SG741]|uniref:hypothetical protein n=1 Tax=Rhizobium sp. SG741 TaxID=2587114 RepID=UPI00144755C4|nr:hypothetical protein [Rhizobium sp. SG741]NKJ03733.1 hypothetical protein [Rhizobium sp. SG741]
MDLEHLSSVLNEISDRLNYVPDPTSAAEHLPELVEFERWVLELMTRDALSVPGHDWDFWNLMAGSFAEFNRVLRSVGAPELKLVTFDAFEKVVASAAGFPTAHN